MKGTICGVEGAYINRLTKTKSPVATVFSIDPVGTTNDPKSRPLTIMMKNTAPNMVLNHETICSTGVSGSLRFASRAVFHSLYLLIHSVIEVLKKVDEIIAIE
jgi:hypothetical protein